MRAIAITTLLLISACQTRSRAPEYQIIVPKRGVIDIETQRHRNLQETEEALSG